MASAFLGRALFLGGGMVGRALGGALSGIGSAVGGIASGAGSAIGGIAQGIGSAVGGALTPAPKVVVNNIGMVGDAAKKKVTGSGTLPNPKKAAKRVVNVNMPTEKLLVVAVSYLASIDKTLQDQLKFESQAFSQQVAAEKEAAIEKKDSVFSKISNKFTGLLNSEDDSTVSSRASNLTKAILAAAGISGLGLLALGAMDDSELNRLKNSWEEFSKKYDWLIDMASTITGAGAGIGYMVGGWRGAVYGAVADWLSERLTGSTIGDHLLGLLGLGGGENTDAAAANRENTGFDYAMGSVVAGYGAYRGVKTARDLRARGARINQIRTAPRAAPSLRGSGFRDPVTGRAASRAAVAEGGGWLSGPVGRRFVAFLSRRFGASYIARKIMPLLARVMVGLAVTATGIGAIPGIIWTLINVGLAIWTVYDLLDAWWDFQDEEEARGDAEAVNNDPPTRQDDATQTGGTTVSGTPSEASARSNSSSGDPLPPAASGSIDAILDKNPEQLTDAELRQLVEAQGRIEDPSGRLNNPGGIRYGTGPLKDHQIGFRRANGDSSVRIAVYDTPENGIRAAMENWRNSRYYRGKSVREGLGTWSGGNGAHYARMLGSARPGYEGTNNPQGESGTGNRLVDAGIDMVSGAFKAIAGIAEAGLGPQTARSTTNSLTQGMSPPQPAASTPPPVVAAAAANDNRAAEISAASRNIQNTLELGDANAASAEMRQSAETPAQTSLRRASEDNKIEVIDPNYPGTRGSIIDGYLQYYRLAS